MHFDVIFLDCTANKYYDRQTLEKQPLGGTEATVIRIAESLGSLGLTVAVVQTKVDEFETTMGQFCFFMHANKLSLDVTCDHYIQLRRNLNPQLFPGSKKYLWCHDLSVADPGFSAEELRNNDIKVIAVSRWHKKDITKFLKSYDNVTYIYNPVPDDIYAPPTSYDKNLLVWTSSPHKGLGKALELFKLILKERPQMKLIVYNPGYFSVDHVKLASESRVYYAGAESCRNTWNTVKKALAVFYPTQWDETFGMIGSEANALGTPVASYRRGALREVLTESQLVDRDDEAGIVKLVLDWNTNGKPAVAGKEEFKLSNVLLDWCKLLGYSLIAR